MEFREFFFTNNTQTVQLAKIPTDKKLNVIFILKKPAFTVFLNGSTEQAHGKA